MTDEDFLMETRARENPAGYVKALRAQWAGDALAEEKYVSMKPGTGGFWNILAVFQKKAIVAQAKPEELAALGTELGEANQSPEERARALVKATVTDADKEIKVDSNGIITLPAAACGGAQILGSFLGGHQLFSGGGAITSDFQAPAAGTYDLTMRVATVQLNPDVELTINDSKSPVSIAVPYTIGHWQQTQPVRISLVQGKNSLRFTRPEGSRGLAAKEFTLAPVK